MFKFEVKIDNVKIWNGSGVELRGDTKKPHSLDEKFIGYIEPPLSVS